MKLLAIDTSTDYLSLAVLDNGKIRKRFHRHIGRNHSTLLIPSIDKLLKKAGLNIKKIDGFCVGVGPGSFTGLRIGVATIKGLAYSLKKPVVAVPSIDAIAENAKDPDGIICPVLDAKKGKVYGALYRSNRGAIKRISKYLLISTENLNTILGRYDKITILGDGAGLMGRQAHISDWYPRADVIARIGLEYFKRRKFTSPEDLEPLYLYSGECDIKGI